MEIIILIRLHYLLRLGFVHIFNFLLLKILKIMIMVYGYLGNWFKGFKRFNKFKCLVYFDILNTFKLRTPYFINFFLTHRLFII